MPKRTIKTAAQLMEELKKDPTWVARTKSRENEEAVLLQTSSAEQAELLHDLKDNGLDVSTVWDLVNSNDDYSHAIPVLIKHLQRQYSVGIKEGIVRALTTRWAIGSDACTTLIQQYKTLNDNSESGLKWVIGNAISIVADQRYVEDLVSIMLNSSNGRTRDMIVLRFPSVAGRAMAQRVLPELLGDPCIKDFVTKALNE